MLRCEQVRDMMSSYIDKQLKSVELLQFNKHIKTCKHCKKELSFLQSIVTACNDMEEVELPANFKQQLHEKLLQVKQDKKHNTPPWYLNWRMYSGLVAGILLVVLFNLNPFMPFYKTEKAYVNDINMDYHSAGSMVQREEKKETMDKRVYSHAEAAESFTRDESSSYAMKDAMLFSAPVAENSIEDNKPPTAPKEPSAKNGSGNGTSAPAQEPIPEQIEPEKDTLNMLQLPPQMGGNEMGDQVENGEESASQYDDGKTCRRLSEDRKSIISYTAIVKITEENANILWDKVQTKLAEYDDKYKVLYKSGIPVIRIPKEYYPEMEQYIRSTGVELTIEIMEQDEMNNYRNLLDKCNMLDEKIAELENKLRDATTQEEKDDIQKQMVPLLKQQQSINNEISDLQDSIDKYSIYLEIV